MNSLRDEYEKKIKDHESEKRRLQEQHEIDLNSLRDEYEKKIKSTKV